jgi:hypothetical protein
MKLGSLIKNRNILIWGGIFNLQMVRENSELIILRFLQNLLKFICEFQDFYGKNRLLQIRQNEWHQLMSHHLLLMLISTLTACTCFEKRILFHDILLCSMEMNISLTFYDVLPKGYFIGKNDVNKLTLKGGANY